MQLSVVRVFAQILTDKAFKSQAHSAELIHFCTSTTQNLFSRLLPEATAHQSSEQGKDLRPKSVFLIRIDWSAQRAQHDTGGGIDTEACEIETIIRDCRVREGNYHHSQQCAQDPELLSMPGSLGLQGTLEKRKVLKRSLQCPPEQTGRPRCNKMCHP